MTTTVKIHVNGLYVAKVTNKTTGTEQFVGPNAEETIYFRHGQLNDITIEEKFVGDQEWYKEYVDKRSSFLSPEASPQE